MFVLHGPRESFCQSTEESVGMGNNEGLGKNSDESA